LSQLWEYCIDMYNILDKKLFSLYLTIILALNIEYFSDSIFVVIQQSLLEWLSKFDVQKPVHL